MENSAGHHKHAPRERVLFVHAHPDDESISTGAAIATIVAHHGHATVLTCTRGERGEVIPEELRHLEGSPSRLSGQRERELAAALEILGVADHRYLGDANARWSGRLPRRYTDSGMQWGVVGAEPLEASDPDSFSAAEFAEVATDIAAVIAAVEPTAVVTYDDRGGYGHPDHIRAHYAARRAADVMGVPFFVVVDPAAAPTVDDIVVDVTPVLEIKRAALAAHRTQIRLLDEESFVLSSGAPRPIGGVERFRRQRRDRSRPAHAYRDQSSVTKAMTVALALIVGIVAGATLTIVHQATVSLAGATVPVGLILGLVVVTALFAGLRLVFGTRAVAGAAALGALVTIGILAAPSAGGSVLVPAGLFGYAWIFGPTFIALIVLAWPAIQAPRATSQLVPEGTDAR